FRELQYFGFIVMTEPGCLGVDGKGKAPHWRLTELGYMNDPPTRDFIRWDGSQFHDRSRRSKMQNPVSQMQDTLSRKCKTPASRNDETSGVKSVSQSGAIQVANPVSQLRDITSLPLPATLKGRAMASAKSSDSVDVAMAGMSEVCIRFAGADD